MFTQHLQQIVMHSNCDAWGFTRTRVWERYLLENGGEIQRHVQGKGRLGAGLPMKSRQAIHKQVVMD